MNRPSHKFRHITKEAIATHTQMSVVSSSSTKEMEKVLKAEAKAIKEAEKAAEKAAKQAEKEAEKAAKQAEKEAEKAAKQAEKQAKKAEKEAEKAAKAAEPKEAKKPGRPKKETTPLETEIAELRLKMAALEEQCMSLQAKMDIIRAAVSP